MGDLGEVKKEVKEVKNESLLDIVFLSIQAGKTLPQISKDLHISKQKLQYYVNKLKNQNQIQKIGYGVWQTSKNTVANSVRLHGLMWHLKLPKEILIWKEILNKKNISFQEINNGKTLQIYFKENKVWISKRSIIIYDIKSYFGFNAVDSKKYAMFSLQSFLNELQAKLGIDLQYKHNFIVKVSRQHYALVRNALAIQCKKDGTKINVYNERGLWFTIDNSFNLNEAETVHPQSALVDNLGVQRFFNEHKETKWEVSPKWTLEAINGVVSNQLMFNKNFESHVKAVQQLGNSAKANSETVIQLADVIRDLKDEVVNLRQEISSLKNEKKDI